MVVQAFRTLHQSNAIRRGRKVNRYASAIRSLDTTYNSKAHVKRGKSDALDVEA